jgi:hypothetical protein
MDLEHSKEMIQNYFQLRERYLDHTGAVNVLAGNLDRRRFGDFLNEYGILYSLENTGKLNMMQLRDAERYQGIQSEAKNGLKDWFTAEDSLGPVNTQKRPKKETKRTAMAILRSMFNLEEKTTYNGEGRKIKVYRIQSERTLQDLHDKYQITREVPERMNNNFKVEVKLTAGRAA